MKSKGFKTSSTQQINSKVDLRIKKFSSEIEKCSNVLESNLDAN